MIGTASLALKLAKQEIIRHGRYCPVHVFANHHSLPGKGLVSRSNFIYSQESEVNYLRDEIKSYLLNISLTEQVSSQRVNQSFLLLYSLNEYEKICGLYPGNLANRAEKWLARGYVFSTGQKRN